VIRSAINNDRHPPTSRPTSTDRAGLTLGGLTNRRHAAAVKDCCVNHTSANISTDIKLLRGLSAIAGALVHHILECHSYYQDLSDSKRAFINNMGQLGHYALKYHIIPG